MRNLSTSLLRRGIVAAAVGIALVLGFATASFAAGGVTAGASCQPDPTTACIQGTLRDDNGNAVAGVKVTATDPSGASASVTTDATGVFKFAGTAAGDYRIAIDPATLPSGVTIASPTTTAKNVQLGALKPVIIALAGHGTGSQSNDIGPSTTGQLVWQAFTQGLLLGLLLALASIGLSLVYGTTGISNFAHGEQVTLGGFMAYIFSLQLGWNFVLASLMAVVVGAASGYVQDLAIWAPLRRKGIGISQLMLVSIGLSFALQYLYQFFFGALPLPVTADIQQIGGPLYLTPSGYWSMGVSIVVLVLVGLALTRTRIGRATRAVADNPALAAASGIDNNRIIRLVWTVSMGLAALSGALYALVNNGINWSTGLSILLLMFAAVTLGGIGTAFGALVGSLIIGIVVQMTGIILPGDLKYATALLVLIVILIFRPQGILGRSQRVG
ncbi:branched-chain amino acid ABC transporter permease [Gryllotalpicola sp.]|uniref:branched-chain amino acid ABC transporter permease n=1 Tax=Gryllotalpicola sp. TaxID=1932787 RepID=UPI0026384CE7|nr:branched-chain amino acid ABC transporter permease [Gryllotalpicola sp.]